MEPVLTADEKKQLLEIAHATIVAYLTDGNVPVFDVQSPSLKEKRGCFVCVKQKGMLRGCIGNFISTKPLWQLVQEMAISAATRDPRFYPMRKEDLDTFTLEISVLSPLRKVESVEEIQVGVHGLYLEKNQFRGVLLPQVAVEQKWDRETFLAQTCIKAGLGRDDWKEGAEIHIFSADVFGDKGK